jgi:hypothetical protein
MAVNIVGIQHPFYIQNLQNWLKWRLTYEGGDVFIETYLRQVSRRESIEDYRLRKLITYCPAFAKVALNDIKNSIFQRISDVTRKNGSKSYQESVVGLNGGVDKTGQSMNAYLGRRVLPELLSMAKVGIFVDMPQLNGPLLADKGTAHPYIYLYRAEQIKSWTYDANNPDWLSSVLLENDNYTVDDETGLTIGVTTDYRHFWLNEEGYVNYVHYDTSGKPTRDVQTLGIRRVPLVCLELSSSLLADAANYQIALLNLESSDLLYALRSNFPFYTEQFDPRTESMYLKQPAKTVELIHTDHSKEDTQEIVVGTTAGRLYPVGLERPAFINPSSEPLKVSMEKADQIKKDIRQLVNLAVQNLEPRRVSAESKQMDNQSLESGLSYIGLELEHAENQIAILWSEYEGNNDDIATIKYPEKYNIKSEDERQLEVDRLENLIPKVPSSTFKKEATKRVAELSISSHISYKTLEKIHSEIDGATVIDSDPDVVGKDLENGLVSVELASEIRGYPPGQVEIAKKDQSANPKDGIQEKQLSRDTTLDPIPTDKTRGPGQYDTT